MEPLSHKRSVACIQNKPIEPVAVCAHSGISCPWLSAFTVCCFVRVCQTHCVQEELPKATLGLDVTNERPTSMSVLHERRCSSCNWSRGLTLQSCHPNFRLLNPLPLPLCFPCSLSHMIEAQVCIASGSVARESRCCLST